MMLYAGLQGCNLLVLQDRTAESLPGKGEYIKLLFIHPLTCCNSSTISELNIQASVMNLSSSRLCSLGRNRCGSATCFYFKQLNYSLDGLNFSSVV